MKPAVLVILLVSILAACAPLPADQRRPKALQMQGPSLGPRLLRFSAPVESAGTPPWLEH